MRRLFRLAALSLLLPGCAQFAAVAPGGAPPGSAAQRPQARPDAPGALSRTVPESARTAEEFDVTSAEERAVAAAPADAGERRLGTTVASLGDPSKAGFWIRTPLASEPGEGRVVYPGTGKSSQVELIPIAGGAGAGSRLSLAAMRLIGAPLTGLPEVEVYRN